MKMDGYEVIEVTSRDEGAALEIKMNSPKGNILSMQMMKEISAALDANAERNELRMILLCAEGKHFSFGASVEEHRKEQAPSMLASFHEFIRKLAAYPVPVVSLVQGSCLGGAFEMVLASHLVFATDDANFGCPEIQLGVFPPVLAAIGPHRLGGAVSERMLLCGSTIDASTAERIGFVSKVFAKDDAEESIWGFFREELASRSGFALRQATKASRGASGLLEALREPLAALEKQYVDEVVPSHDGDEGIEAFLARRKPSWKHQ
ncbi:MAG: cyclohexa-1,5-dienecarbonyl-CoA hydratase [Deltaproteobacteria bacterium]|nr:cyclohexa-1,5-dienecarbonyl-CoA hydratase [Deltaproteobacteria bacterium]